MTATSESADQPAELRRGQEAVGLAAVLLRGDIGDEGLCGRPERRRADALEQPEEHEPVRVRRRREQQERDRVEGGADDHHGLAPDGVAEPAEGRREEQRAQIEHRGDHPDHEHRAVRLLLQEDRQIGDDGAEADPGDEAAGRHHAELEPARARRGGGRGHLCVVQGGHDSFARPRFEGAAPAGALRMSRQGYHPGLGA
jgi:hypothetical protein